MGPSSILGYFSSWWPLLVWGPEQVAPPCPPLSAALFNTTLNVLSNTQAMMDRQKKNELPRMQVQFFDNVGIPIFRVSQTVNWWFVKKENISFRYTNWSKEWLWGEIGFWIDYMFSLTILNNSFVCGYKIKKYLDYLIVCLDVSSINLIILFDMYRYAKKLIHG